VARPERRLLTCLALAAALCAAAGGFLHVAELALYLTPCFLIVGLLLSGRFVGEDGIVRRRCATEPPPARHVRPRWATPPAPAALRSLLERSPASRRGPPAPALLAA